MGTTKTYGLGGGVAGTSEIDDDTDPSVLIEGSDGLDYIEIDTSNSAPKVILAGGGAAVQLGSSATKVTTGGETAAVVAAGGIHIKEGDASASSINGDYDGLYVENSDHAGLTIHAGTAASENKRAGIGFGHGGATVSATMYYTNNAAAPTFNFGMGPGGASCLQFVQNSQGSRRPILGADWFFMPRNDVVDNNTYTDAAWLDDSGATLVVDFANGNAAMVTLTANITAVKFINTPDSYAANIGLIGTVTVRLQQHASSAKTISYAVGTTSVHTGDEDSGAHGSSELYWSGGVPHTMSTGTDDVDLVQFTIFADRATNYNVYGTVIGQDFQTV